MEPLSATASIVGLAAVTLKVIKYVSSVKDSSSERRSLKEESEGLLQLLDSLQSTLDDAGQSATCFESIKTLVAPKGPLDQLREALEQLNKKVEPKKSVKDYARALTWTLDKDHCNEVLGKIERVKSLISLALQGETRQRLRTIQEGFASRQIKEDESERRKILDWFSPLNFFKTQQDVFKKRQEDTGLWFIESPQFQDWRTGPTEILCCVGIPGAGKSVLASVVVDHLRNRHQGRHRGAGRSVAIAVAYCNFKETKTHDAENLLAGLAMQMIVDHIPIPETLTKLHQSHRTKQTRPTLKEICSVVYESAKSFDDLYLIIDALDECPTEARTVLIQELKDLPSKLLVTTRPIDGIIRQFDRNPIVQIRASDEDLDIYIQSRLGNSGRLSALLRGNHTLADDIRQKIIAKANGMFLAAELHVNSVSSKMSVKALKKAIDELPTTLNQLYDDAFHRIDTQNEDDREMAYKALRWVAYAYQPLTIQILEEILAVDSESQDFDCEAMPLLSLVLDVCAGLLIIDEQTQHVRLVHYTTQDYFDALVASRFKDAHESIARDCITFLGYDTFQRPPAIWENRTIAFLVDENAVSDGQLQSWKRKYHLLPYASCFWARHAVAGRQTNLSAQINTYLARNPRVWLSVHIHKNRETLTSDELDKCTGCGVAAYFGLCEALELILPMTDNINVKTYKGLYPLYLAAINDQAATIEILLEHGADTECKASMDGYKTITPLLHSINSESDVVARVLLDHGADPMCIDDHGYTPFASVAWDSPIPILEQLLKCGADIDSISIFGETQLTKRAARNDVRTVQWLLQNGASINLQDRLGHTALSLALEKGSVESAQLLLNCGANFKALDSDGRASLQNACKNKNNTALVRYLLNEGISINAVDNEGATALHYAALFNFGEAVDLLIANHAEIDNSDIDGRTPLMRAVRRDFMEVMELLLANHADIDKSDNAGRTPLMEAVNMGSADAMNTLLGAGANVNAQDCDGLTALHFSAIKGNVAAISELLKSSVICAMRNQMTISVTHIDDLGLREHLCASVIDEHTVGKHKDDVDSYLQENLEVSFLSRQNVQNISPWRARKIMDGSGEIQECRIWADGMTALDIADIRKDTVCSSLLETVPGMSRSEYSTTNFGDYIADLFGLPDMAAVVEELKRREKNKGQESLSSRVPSDESLSEDESYEEAETKEAENEAETDFYARHKSVCLAHHFAN